MKMFRFFDPKNEINFVRFFKPSLYVAMFIPIIAIVGAAILGLNWGIDFTGGAEMQIQFTKHVEAEDIRNVLDDLGFTKSQVQRYGAVSNNEMLVRVERLSTFKPEDAALVKTLLLKEFTKQISPESAKSVEVKFNKNVSDRFTVKMPEPAYKKDSSADEINQALQAQHSKLAQAIDTKSEFKLRRSKSVGSEVLDINDAILRDEPKDGLVMYNVHFISVSDKIAAALTSKFGQAEIRRVEFVDSQVSKQLRTDGTLAVFYAILAILIYIAIRFDIFFSPGAVVALLQDTFGGFLVFVFARYEFDLPSIAALLTVVGVSINNTIIVYDRIRETLPSSKNNEVDEATVTACVNKAVNDTLSRTINTTLTTLFCSISLWIFAGGVIKSFAIVLTVGLALGAVSSTFAAPATYLLLRRRFGKEKNKIFSLKPKTGYTREDKQRGVV